MLAKTGDGGACARRLSDFGLDCSACGCRAFHHFVRRDKVLNAMLSGRHRWALAPIPPLRFAGEAKGGPQGRLYEI